MSLDRAIAPFVLALFALSVVRNRSASRLMLVVAGFAACFAYYAVMYQARSMGLSGVMPTVLVAWLPNLTVVGAAAVVAMVHRRTALRQA